MSFKLVRSYRMSFKHILASLPFCHTLKMRIWPRKTISGGIIALGQPLPRACEQWGAFKGCFFVFPHHKNKIPRQTEKISKTKKTPSSRFHDTVVMCSPTDCLFFLGGARCLNLVTLLDTSWNLWGQFLWRKTTDAPPLGRMTRKTTTWHSKWAPFIFETSTISHVM